MSILPLFFSLAAFCLSVNAFNTTYEGYKLIEAETTAPLKRQLLRHLERHHIIDSNQYLFRKDVSKIDFIVSASDAPKVLQSLEKRGIPFKIKEEDVGRVLKAERERLETARAERFNAFDVNDWNRLEDINKQLDVWASNCATGVACSVYSIGKSYENQDLNVLKISRNDGQTRKAVWLDATIHSREWISLGTILKIMDHFVYNYDTDSDVKYLVDNYDWYFLAVLNPDGYVRTWDEDRFWRKNTRPSPENPNCIGVDLNRNYDVNWGKEGVDHWPCGTAYCGDSPNSEPETKAVVEAVKGISQAQGIQSFITYHGYGRMWMFPWGNTIDFKGKLCERTDDYDDLMAVAKATANAIGKVHGTYWYRGTSCEVIYATTGGSDDWAKAKAGVKYAFNPELRGNSFVIDKSEIVLSFEENWEGLIANIKTIEAVESLK